MKCACMGCTEATGRSQEQEGKKMIDVGKNIKEIRVKKGLTQEELGKRVGISKQGISLYEKNKRRLTLEMLDKIAKALNCERYDIFKSTIDPSKIELNDELINNVLETNKALARTATDAITVAALEQLMQYRETGLTPDEINGMKKRHEKIDLMAIEYDNICEKYDKLYGKEQM